MTAIKKQLFILFLLMQTFSARAQFNIKEVTNLGKLTASHISYYPENKEWIFSDGYVVFKAWNDFKDAKMLFNSFPYYQFSLERFPNKNFFSRHFDTKSPPYGIEPREKYLDSSRIYIMQDSLKKINKLSPSSFIKVINSTKNEKVIVSAANNCFNWGKDSTVFCNNGTIGIERKINGKDSVRLIYTRQRISEINLSADGDYGVVGTKDSGWYFIPTLQPDNYLKINAQEKESEISAFYFDDKRQQLWVKEEDKWNRSFISISQYDYSRGQPVFIKSIKAEAAGLATSNSAQLVFDFTNNKCYIKDGIRTLLQFDLKSELVTHDFFWNLQNLSISIVSSIYFNTADQHLYIAAGKYDSSFSNSYNFLFLAERDSISYANSISPKNKKDEQQLYPIGLSTAVNRLPLSSYSSDDKTSLSSNGLALIPTNQNEYLLYNIRNGNMITALQAANIDLNAQSVFSKTNTAKLSPNGKYIFEWLIKSGSTSGIADTLQVALTNVLTGNIKRNKMLLSAQINEEIEAFYWDEQDLPVFVKKYSKKNREYTVETFRFDTSLLTQTINLLSFNPKEAVLYNVWQMPDGKNYLIETGLLYSQQKVNQYSLINKNQTEPLTLLSSPNNVHVELNNSGLLLKEEKGDSTFLHWHNTSGKKLHTTLLPGSLRIQQLSAAFYLYCTNTKTNKAVKINLLDGSIRTLQSKVNTDYSYSVSPDESLLVSISDKIQTWQLQQDTLYKLYELKTEKNYITKTQITDKYLVSDGRIWNLSTGFLIQADQANKTIINDSLQLSSIIPDDIIDPESRSLWGEEDYRLKPHQKLFAPSITTAKNIKAWQEAASEGRYNKVLLATSGITDNTLQNIYELPFFKDLYDEIKMVAIAGQQAVLLIKSGNKMMEDDLLTSPADTLILLDLQTGKYPTPLTGKIVRMKQMPGNGPFLFYLLNQKTKALQAYKIQNNEFKKVEHVVKFDYDSLGKVNIVDEFNIAYQEEHGAVIRNMQTNKKEQIGFNYISGLYSMASRLFYDPEDKSLFIGYDDGGIVKIKNNKVVDCVHSMPDIESFAGTKGKFLIALDKLGNYHFINKETLVADLKLFTWKDENDGNYSNRKYIWLTAENYYMATPGVENNIHFVQNSQVIPLRQGDLQYNRPDKVLEYLNAPQTDIDFYKQLYQIRQKKYNTRTTSTAVEPTIQFNTTSAITDKILNLTANVTATEKITKLQVQVNGCPIMVQPLTYNNGKELKQTIQIPLNAGPNKIYAWAEDEKGNRSSFSELKVTGEFADSGKWYFMGIGVSNYKDSLQNLKYADKDIRDIAEFMATEYPGIQIDTLFNEQVTAANIRLMSNKLKATHPDDKVMVSFSGHGLLDDQNKFWYATHDIDFLKPEQAGFSMTAITAMLDNIPARYRMITLDACHSGDVVSGFTSPAKTEVFKQPAEDKSTIKGSILLNHKKENNASSALLLKSMQMVFTDQLSNTGINLIAASSGTEYALEGDKWNNGVFTYALINGWAYAAKKESYNDQIHYRDLKQYLQQRVSAITNGRQTPNTVMENGEIDWWLVPVK